VWTPGGVSEADVEDLILKKAGDLLVKHYLFDTFSKDGKTSYAFRLVFQSNERTLSDDEINPIMEAITASMNAKEGWQVR
jgi:phenylalanyl-tRNA synthetase beta chain